MKKISYRHKKIAAEKDSKDLSGVYFRAVRKDAEKDLPESPLGEQEDRRSYFQRLNNHIESNKQTYDNSAPFGRDAITFVGTIPESELESLEKGDRLNFVKWVASNYSEFSQSLTLDNVSKIRSLIEASPEYSFSAINNYSPDQYLQALVESDSEISAKPTPTKEGVLGKLNLDPELLSDTDSVFSKENRPNIGNTLSDREILMLKAGAVLTNKVNSLDLILDFLFSENSDIEVEKPGDLEALFPFSFDSEEGIRPVFEAIDQKQEEWHIAISDKAEGASSSSGDYGYGYLTNIVVHDFGDGWKLVYLPGSDDPEMVPWSQDKKYSHDRIQEGDNNSLCLGSGSKLYNDNGRGRVYSLRDPSNKPIATMRMELDLREAKDLSQEYFHIEELWEKHNKPLGIESSIYIRSFFESRDAYSSNLNTYAKSTTEGDLATTIQAVKGNDDYYDTAGMAADIFDWIHFLNKKRSDRNQSEKYSEYLAYYNDLIEVRNDLYNDDSGLFFNGSSISNDESRVRKYIYRILTKISQSNTSSFVRNDFKGRLFGSEIEASSLKTFYNRILPGIPDGKNALALIAKESPKTVYKAVNSSNFSMGGMLKEYGMIAAKTLLSGGGDYLKTFFDALTSIYTSVFFDKDKDFKEEYKNQNVIDYLEAFYLEKNDLFIKKELYLYYYGNNPDVNNLIKEIFNRDLKTHLEKVKKDNLTQSKPGTFNHKIINYIKNNGQQIIWENLIDKELAYDISKYLEEYVEAHKNTPFLISDAFKKYFIFKKISQVNDENFAHNDSDIIKEVLDSRLDGLYSYTDIFHVSDSIFDLISLNFISFSSPELVQQDLRKIFGSKIEECYSDDLVNNNKYIYTLIVINIVLKKISENFKINFNDLIERSEPSKDQVLKAFSNGADLFFTSGISNMPKYSDLKNDLVMKHLDAMFNVGPYSSHYGIKNNAFNLVKILEEVRGDKLIFDEVKDKIDSVIREKVEEATVTATGTERSEEAARIILTIKSLYIISEKLKEVKSLAGYRRDILSRLKNQTKKLSDYVKEAPQIFYDHKIYEIPNINIDRRELALLYIEEILMKSRGLEEDTKNLVLKDLGLNKTARSLSSFFIKGGFLRELNSLVNLFAS